MSADRSMLRRLGPWMIWIALAVVAAPGLRHYRVDNAIDRWVPGHEASGPLRSYLVLGGEAEVFDADAVAAQLSVLTEVAFCISPLNAAAHGVSPDAFVVGEGGAYVGVFCFAAPGVSDDNLVAATRRLIGDRLGKARDQIAFGGPAVFHVALNDFSQTGLAWIMAAVALVGIITLQWATRCWAAAIATMFAIGISQIILLGCLSARGVAIDMALSIVPPLTMALGFSFAAHRIVRPHAVRVQMLCALTTIAGLATFSIAAVTPVRDFAVYGSLSLLIVFAAVQTMVPIRPQPPSASHNQCNRRHHPYLLLIVAAILSVIGLCVAPFLRFADNPVRYFPPGSAIARDYQTLERRLTGMLPFEVAVDGRIEVAELFRDTPGIRKVIDATNLTGSAERTFWCLANGDSLSDLRKSRQRWQAYADRRGAALDWKGVAAQLSEAERAVVHAAVWALPSMIAVAVLAVYFTSRRWTWALLSGWINSMPVTILAIVAAIFNWELTMPSLMIGAIAVGVSVDDTMHLLAALRQSGSVVRAWEECRRPCVGSSLVAAACLVLFVAAPFRPTAQFGLMMAIAIIAAVFADMFVLPAALLVLGDRAAHRHDCTGHSSVNGHILEGAETCSEPG